MTFQIRSIVLYSHTGDRRELELHLGRPNVITGASRSGKSALIDIIDYCLGSKSYSVPAGPIRERVAWFGLMLQIGAKSAFVARRAPAPVHQASTEVYLEYPARDVPDYPELHQVTNIAGLVDSLSRWCGISENIHIPENDATRERLEATIRHSVFYCFQRQDEIVSQRNLFHSQHEQFIPQAIRDTFPYFVGAVDPDYVTNRMMLNSLQRDLRRLERRASESRDVYAMSGRLEALFHEARRVGLVDADKPDEPDLVLDILRSVVAVPSRLELAPEQHTEPLHDLLATRRELRMRFDSVADELSVLRHLQEDRDSYGVEADEHVARLQSVGIIDWQQETPYACPVCGTGLDHQLPNVGNLVDSLRTMERELEQVTRGTPRLESAIGEREAELGELRAQLEENQEAIDELSRSQAVIQELRDDMARRAHVSGRIAFFLDHLPERVDSELEERITSLESQIADLMSQLDRDAVRERVASHLFRISSRMTEVARRLDLEHSGSPARLDMRELTVVIDSPTGPIPMAQMGSAENWVGFHIAAHLALHEDFALRDRPVPRFLILDQPSQVYFPPDFDPEVPIEFSDDDRASVRRLFRTIFESVADLSPRLQVIITEHADLDDEWFQDAVVERWRHGDKLVPESWQQRGSHDG